MCNSCVTAVTVIRWKSGPSLSLMLHICYHDSVYRIDLHYRIDFKKIEKMGNFKKVLSLNGGLSFIKLMTLTMGHHFYHLKRYF